MLVPVGGQETQGQKVLALTRKLAKEEVALELGEENKGMPRMEYCTSKAQRPETAGHFGQQENLRTCSQL